MKAKLGQNFLINDTIKKQIVSYLDVQKDDLIIEIGPGKGALTKYLKDLPSKLVCIEVDTSLAKYLNNLDVEVIYEDILNIDLNKLLKGYNYNNLIVIGNLPYYITTPIITKLIESKLNIKQMIFMVQNEVADRLCADIKTKDYGYMTLFANFYYDVKKLLFVGKKEFSPVPKVDSAVIEFTLNNKNYDLNETKFFNFLKKCFAHKRKTLKNNLNIDDFNELDLENNLRPEEIDLEQYIDIFNRLK